MGSPLNWIFFFFFLGWGVSSTFNCLFRIFLRSMSDKMGIFLRVNLEA